MNLRSQLYLLQLEDYNLDRWREWIKNNPHREVIEKKGKINWTLKAQVLYLLAHIFGLEAAVKLLLPIDWFLKLVLVLAAKIKLSGLKRLIVIGVVGSWGKTTTKDHLALMLDQKYKIFKTAGNNNTLLGVALSVLKMPFDTQVFVCEIGEYYPGDIRQLCQLVRPKIGVITAIGPMHLERFGTMAKLEETLHEIDGFVDLLIEPGQDPIKKLADYFKVAVPKEFPASPHRLEMSKNNGVTIIDDSYNSNPEGFLMALGKMKGKPKILVTPGMIEMGNEPFASAQGKQFEENKKAAAAAAKNCDEVIVVGKTNREAWLAGLGKFKYHLASDLEEVQKILSRISKPGAVILFENDLPDHYF